jgi:hypothetical protein
MEGTAMLDTTATQERYYIGRDGVFATLYDRKVGRLVVENSTEEHCRKVSARLLVQQHDMDGLDKQFARMAPGHP